MPLNSAASNRARSVAVEMKLQHFRSQASPSGLGEAKDVPPLVISSREGQPRWRLTQPGMCHAGRTKYAIGKICYERLATDAFDDPSQNVIVPIIILRREKLAQRHVRREPPRASNGWTEPSRFNRPEALSCMMPTMTKSAPSEPIGYRVSTAAGCLRSRSALPRTSA